jgi:DNA-binding Lrp family transcriptional regulator
MKNTELRVILELMKNSRRSDRELAKAIGSSQPTVSRTIKKLEKEGIIKEYAMIPDFRKLGFEFMAITFSRFSKELSDEELDELRKRSREVEGDDPIAILMGLNGMGLKSNRVLVTFHKNYSSYSKLVSLIRSVPNMDPSNIESFIINFDEPHYQHLTLSTIADYLLKTKEEK